MDERPHALLESDEEVLAAGGTPRWPFAFAALVAVAALLAALLSRGPSSTPKPTTTPTAAAPSIAAPQALDLDVAVAPTGTWLLQHDTLVYRSAGRPDRDIAVPGLAQHTAVGQLRLITDPASARLWIVVEGGADSWVAAIDGARQAVLWTAGWAEQIRYAAGYRGLLYVTTDRGAAVFPAAARAPQFIDGLSGAVGSLAVDALRHRLVLIDLGYPTNVWTYRPGGSPVEAAAPVPLGKGTLAVTGEAIWVSGFGARGAVVDRLDPATLATVATSPAAARFDPGAVVVAAGDGVFWLSPGGVLSCLDARNGAVRESWDAGTIYGAATTGRTLLLSSDAGLRRLSCPAPPGSG